MNIVFLHDPNGKSLFNDDNTHILLQTYTELINTVLVEYGMDSFRYITYDFPNINRTVSRLWLTLVVGNCVVASIVFMILYHELQSLQEYQDVTTLLKMSNKKDYDRLYTAFYNKIERYIGLIT
jgi:hypothetical protein